jgi:hypothetical protein
MMPTLQSLTINSPCLVPYYSFENHFSKLTTLKIYANDAHINYYQGLQCMFHIQIIYFRINYLILLVYQH